jgi:hypothetical protein
MKVGRVGGREDCVEDWRRLWLERSLVQILVEVANIQLSVRVIED